jgi:hypothetical protein
VALTAVLAYRWLDGGWGLFALLVLAPDLSMLAYLAGPRVGAFGYNIFHTLLGPALLAAPGVAIASPLALQVAAVWLFHIAFDRMLGYGLKLPTAFRDTHLGRVGKDS